MKTDLQMEETISNTVTIAPRLNFANKLLDYVIKSLKEKQKKIKLYNINICQEFDEKNSQCIASLDMERLVDFSIETLMCACKRIRTIHNIYDIIEQVPPLIPMIRTINAQLFLTMPEFSQNLSKISIHLGSVVFDSANLACTQFDFNQSNKESTQILDKVKLIVDSKINKQYPNLDFLKC